MDFRINIFVYKVCMFIITYSFLQVLDLVIMYYDPSSGYKQVGSSRMPKVRIQTRSIDFAEELQHRACACNSYFVPPSLPNLGM